MKKPEKVKSDSQRLNELQAAYINGEPAALGQMYSLLYQIAYKFINAISNKDKNIKALTSEDRQIKAHNAAEYIIEQYLTKPAFKIEKSITGYLYAGVRYQLYGGRKCDKMLDFTDEVPERNTKTKIVLFQHTPSGALKTYSTIYELMQANKGLAKKTLYDCLKNGSEWQGSTFEIMEVY